MFATVFTHIEEMLDVRMIEAITNFSFAFIAFEYSDITNQIVVRKLQHDLLLIVQIVGKVDAIHPSASQHADNLIMVNPCARRIRYRHQIIRRNLQREEAPSLLSGVSPHRRAICMGTLKPTLL